MKTLTKAQVSKLNNLINTNNDYITTSVCNINKKKESMTVEMLVHTKENSKSIFVILNDKLEFISINGNHSLPNYLKGSVTLKN